MKKVLLSNKVKLYTSLVNHEQQQPDNSQQILSIIILSLLSYEKISVNYAFFSFLI